MPLIRRVTSKFRNFMPNQNGTTAVTFAICIVPLLLCGGAAIDYARYGDAATKLQAALDAGALSVAIASTLPNSQRLKAGGETFEGNLAGTGIRPGDVNYAFTFKGQQVSATAHYPLPAGLMVLAGVPSFEVNVATQINVPAGKKAEIALVLDYSGSMTEVAGGQVKYVAMREAAKKLVTDLGTANPNKVKVGLVPFSHYVYVTLPANDVLGKSGSGTWTGCTQDRRYPYNLTDATPGTDPGSRWGQPLAAVHAKDGCDGFVANNLKVAPLTDDLAQVKAQLDAMHPYAWTHIALGAEFGFHVLSPNDPYTGGAAYSDKNVQKIMVLLTDGRQTEPAFGDGVRTVAQGEQNLEAICQNMKDKGITIITIAFDMRNKDTRHRLSNCSSDPAKDFYVAEESSDVTAAFEDIKKKVAAQVFISR